jgi:putative NIF3 family GTP cyclohydrolase 1 type 2
MANISIYCPHTSLDACRGGINDWLIEMCIGTRSVSSTSIQPSKNPPKGYEDSGMGRSASLQGGKISIATLVDRVKKGTNLKHGEG